MPIHPIDRYRAADGPQGPRKTRAPGADSELPKPASDGIEISEEARGRLELQEIVSSARTAAAAAPEVRQDRVDQARQRVQQGYYDRPEVRGSIVDSLLQAFRSQ